MSECEKCHGEGKVTCSKCGGKKKIKCDKCNGHGTFRDCSNCGSTGKVDCPSCDGSGKKISICPVCDRGKVEKTRWINCRECSGRGKVEVDASDSIAFCAACGEIHNLAYVKAGYKCDRCGSRNWRPGIYNKDCDACNGRGQIEETYKEICPNCHGEYRRKTSEPCKECGGTGKVRCSRCEGTGEARCQKCSASGKVECDMCHGKGSVKCPDCEKREREAKEKREREEREAKEKREREEREAEERRERAARKKEQARLRARKRRERILGFLWRFTVALATGLIAWWWLEGFAREALPGMLDQLKGISGGVSPNLKIAAMTSGGTFIVLYVLTMIGVGRVTRFLAVMIGCVPTTVLFINGHWGVGSVMAIALLAVIVAIFENKVHGKIWRWIVMVLGLAMSGGFGMENCWILSTVLSLISAGVVLHDN